MLSSTDKKDTKEDIMHVFNLFDHDASGKITIEDLRRVADELGEDITDEELRNMIARADTNEDSTFVIYIPGNAILTTSQMQFQRTNSSRLCCGPWSKVAYYFACTMLSTNIKTFSYIEALFTLLVKYIVPYL
jgi:EF-hand domain pair